MRACILIFVSWLTVCVGMAVADSEIITLGQSAQQITYSGPTPVDALGTLHVTLGACSFDSTAYLTNCVMSGPASDTLGNITAYQFVESYAGNGPSPMTGTLNPDGTFTAHANGAINTSDFTGGVAALDPFNDYLNFDDVKGESKDNNHKDWLFVMDTTQPSAPDVSLLNCGGLGQLPCNLFDIAETPGSEMVTYVFSGAQSPVPEPGTMSLMALGLGAALLLRAKH